MNFFQKLLPKTQDVIFVSILIATIGYGPKLFNLDGDLGRHITIGNYILSTFKIPRADIFSNTMYGYPIVPHEWLAEVIFSLANKLLGLSGVTLVTSLVLASTFALVYQEIVQRKIYMLISILFTIWSAAASSIHWLARPHIFTILFLALWTYKLENHTRTSSKDLWFFPCLMLIWSNTHGAFIAGFVVLGIYFTEWAWNYLNKDDKKERGVILIKIGILSFAATFFNPAGYHLWNTSIGYIGNKYLVSHTLEYQSPNFQTISTWPFLLILSYGLFSLHSKKPIHLRDSLLIAIWAVMGLISARNIPLFAIITAPIFAEHLQRQVENINFLKTQNDNLYKIESQLYSFLWPTVSTIAIIILFFRFSLFTQVYNQYDSKTFPVNATEWLIENPQKGNLFNYFTWGGYILYKTWPSTTVFIDGQTDFYGEKLTREYEDVLSLNPGWEQIFQKYNIEWALIPANSPLALSLENDLRWKILYQDKTAVILHK